ncbi:MAG: FAD-linked oxidase C-terminal domain-containing protein, partial [Flavobacteriaceae bacterium]
SRSQDEIKLMKGLKQLFDPKNILNPGRIVN